MEKVFILNSSPIISLFKAGLNMILETLRVVVPQDVAVEVSHEKYADEARQFINVHQDRVFSEYLISDDIKNWGIGKRIFVRINETLSGEESSNEQTQIAKETPDKLEEYTIFRDNFLCRSIRISVKWRNKTCKTIISIFFTVRRMKAISPIFPIYHSVPRLAQPLTKPYGKY